MIEIATTRAAIQPRSLLEAKRVGFVSNDSGMASKRERASKGVTERHQELMPPISRLIHDAYLQVYGASPGLPKTTLLTGQQLSAASPV